MLKDLTFSVRALLKQPTYSSVVIVTLALGIGAATAIFSIVNAVLLEPLPYARPDRLFALHSMDRNGLPTGLMAPRFAEPLYKDHPLVEAGALAWVLSGSIISADRTAYPFMPFRVTDRFFNVFTDSIAMGRAFQPNEPPASIIISHSTWQRYFASNPKIIGSAITVDNSQRTVVGVTRPGFSFPAGAESWQVFSVGPELGDRINFQGYLRLRQNVSPESLDVQLKALSVQLGPNTETGRPLDYVLRPLLDDVVGDMKSTVLLLAGATIILLAIACVNVASLLLARSAARSQEVGLREALGAGRYRIIRQLMTESGVISAIGGALGVGLAYGGLHLLLSIGPADLPRLGAVTVDGRVLLFSAFVVLVTTMLVGLAPAFKLTRPQSRGLGDLGGRSRTSSRAENRMFTILVVAEVGLAVVLVSGAGLLLHSYRNLANSKPSVVSDRVLWMRMNPTQIPLDIRVVNQPDGTVRNLGSGYQPVIDFYQRLTDRLRVVGGVEDVTNTQVLPLVRNAVEATAEPITIVGRPENGITVRVRPVAEDFFSTMGVPILAGREFQATDRRETRGVALVNQAFVRQYFPGEDPLGKRVLFGMREFQFSGRSYGFAERLSSEVEIVGVVPDIRFLSIAEPAVPNLYMSEEQFTTRLRVLVVKTKLDSPANLIPSLRREVAAMAPTAPVEFGVYSESINDSISRQRLGMTLLAVFATIALILAGVGIYGVMAYSVAQRSREIALRAALGASTGEILRMVMRKSAIMAGGGVALGLSGTLALQNVVESQLFEISALDPAVLIPVPLVLLAIALLASSLPARRATQLSPIIALRE